MATVPQSKPVVNPQSPKKQCEAAQPMKKEEWRLLKKPIPRTPSQQAGPAWLHKKQRKPKLITMGGESDELRGEQRPDEDNKTHTKRALELSKVVFESPRSNNYQPRKRPYVAKEDHIARLGALNETMAKLVTFFPKVDEAIKRAKEGERDRNEEQYNLMRFEMVQAHLNRLKRRVEEQNMVIHESFGRNREYEREIWAYQAEAAELRAENQRLMDVANGKQATIQALQMRSQFWKTNSQQQAEYFKHVHEACEAQLVLATTEATRYEII